MLIGWLLTAIAAVMFTYGTGGEGQLRFWALILVIVGAGLILKSKQNE